MAAAAIAAAGLGCNDGVDGACSDLCNDVAACFGAQASGDEIAECENDCVQGFAELPSECEDAAVEIINCTGEALCGEGDLEGCASGIEIPEGCEAALEDGSSGSCCAADDPCDWANDGFCDCSGSFSWDAADCSG